MSENLQLAKRLASEAIVSDRSTIIELSLAIHADPEVSFAETAAASRVHGIVERAGYLTDRPVEQLPTAVRGVIRGSGASGRNVSVGILAEYDALEGIGHACGHNLMAAAGVGAAIGLAAARETFGGEVRFLGTPAEERGAGKQIMIEHALFDELDAAILTHPFDRNHLAMPALALEDLRVSFRGVSSHASSAPWDGANALDSMVQLLSSIGLWRQQLPHGTRVHGIITDGGDAPNVIPAYTSGLFMIRAERDDVLAILQDRFRSLARAAALAHGCSVEVESIGTSRAMRNNATLSDAFEKNARKLGFEFESPDPSFVGSTDMGNVSQAVPSIHPYLQICEPGVPVHSVAFREAAGGRRANETFIRAAIAMAHTALDVLMDSDTADHAQREFAAVQPELVNF